jgi:hypothetical protein
MIDIRFRIVAGNLNYVRNKPFSWAAFDLHNHVQRIRDVCLDGAVWDFNAAL